MNSTHYHKLKFLNGVYIPNSLSTPTITMSLADQTKICYLTAIGRELDAVLDLINKMTEARKIKALGF
jgi:hypothetical protein